MADAGHGADGPHQLTQAATSELRGPHPNPCVKLREQPAPLPSLESRGCPRTARPLPMGGRTGHPACEGLPGAVGGRPSTKRVCLRHGLALLDHQLCPLSLQGHSLR